MAVISTPEEFAVAMKAIFESYDIEAAHGEADDLIIQLLRELGYQAGADIFADADKWYS